MTGKRSLVRFQYAPQFTAANYFIMFYVYVLYSIEYDKIYIGYTSDLQARLTSHNHPQNHSWTARYKPWEIIYHEEFESKKETMIREQQLKSARGREFIKSLLPPK